jgi:hypothetical protein
MLKIHGRSWFMNWKIEGFPTGHISYVFVRFPRHNGSVQKYFFLDSAIFLWQYSDKDSAPDLFGEDTPMATAGGSADDDDDDQVSIMEGVLMKNYFAVV